MSLDALTNPTTRPDSTAAPKRSRRSPAWLLPIGLLIGFIVVIALLFADRIIPAVDVKTAPVITLRLGDQEPAAPADNNPAPQSKGSMIFQASGWIEPDPYTIYVPTLVSGVVDEVSVLEGQSVKKGDLLATLIDDDAKLNLREADQKVVRMRAQIDAHCVGSEIANAELLAVQKKIESQRARLDEAADNLRRLESIPAGAVPRQQVVQARLAKAQQAAQLAEAETEIPRIKARLQQIDLERISMLATVREMETARDRAKLALERTRIIAPMDGIVLRLHAAPGKKRMLNMDDPTSAVIVELYDPNKLQARIDVPLTEAAGIQVGQIVELVSDLLPDATFRGRVTRISGEADLQRNTLQAKVSISNPDLRLRPEMLVRAKFFNFGNTSPDRASATPARLSIFVLEEAIVNGNSVWVVSSDQTAELRQITPGSDIRENHRLVLEGLRSGEHVILPPHSELKPGTRIKPSIQTSN